MLRFTYVASLVGCLLITPAVAGAGDGPSQAMVRINSTGQLEVLGRASKEVKEERSATRMVPVTEQQQRIQKQKVVQDGVEKQVDVPVTVVVTKSVPETYTYTVSKMVYETYVKSFPAAVNGFRREGDKAEIALFDLAGNRMSVTAAENRLHDWTLVLISNSGKPLDRKFANLFKPTTIVVGIPPYQAMATPAYPAPQAPMTVPPQPIPQPAPAPTTSREVQPALTPVAFLADNAPPQLPNSPEPTFAMVKAWGEKTIAVRTESEKTVNLSSQVMKEVEQIVDGQRVKVVVCEPRQMEKLVEIRETIRYPLADVSVTKMPNKELTKSELPSVLAVETLAVVSADGKPVDPLWQRNLRDGALVIVAPAAPAAAPFPVIMPGAPAYAPQPPVYSPPQPVEVPRPAAPRTVPPMPGE